jgi:hypothetical protein
VALQRFLPRVADRHVVTGDTAIPYDAQDATRESAQIVVIEFVGLPEVVDHLRDRVSPLGVPRVLCELVVADLRAVSIPAFGDAQVHALSVRA